MKTIGIIGGGQLGMMIAEAAKKLGYESICLDPNKECSASHYTKEVIQANYDDINALKELGNKSDVLTYEFENVPSEGLKYLKDTFNIPQGIMPLFDSQNRIREKTNAKNLGLNTPKFMAIYSMEDLLKGIEYVGIPCVYKTTTLGYDGHGQVVIKKKEDIEKVKAYLNGEGILEEFIPYDFETSIILIRSKDKIISFPMGVNKHKNGILDLVIVDKKKAIFDEIEKASKAFMEKANYYGILTIEYFVKDDKFYFNEMAPRPHNSGHYTIEGCNVSQYTELVKFLVGKEIEEPKLLHKTIMKNILGFDYENMKKITPNENIFIHDYFKKEVREKRKMAHITFTNLGLDEYDEKYKNIFSEEK